MDTLLAMAIDLATQLQADPRCEAVRAAAAAADADEQLQTMISEFNLKRIAINTEENPDNVKPVQTDRTHIDGGVLTSDLGRQTWNMIRLSK